MHELIFDDEPSLVRVRFWGPLKGAETLQTVRELVRDRRYRTGMNGLIDLRAVEGVELFGDDVRAGAELTTRLGDAFAGARWAVVASSDPTYGIARQFELMASDPRFEIRSFRDLESAERWLSEEPPGG